jgi:hypothetical protein
MTISLFPQNQCAEGKLSKLKSYCAVEAIGCVSLFEVSACLHNYTPGQLVITWVVEVAWLRWLMSTVLTPKF